MTDTATVEWRVPSKEEVTTFLDALRHHAGTQQPVVDIKGSCWTSDPYQGALWTCWIADFDLKPKFEPFFGTYNLSHGYACACLRLVATLVTPDPSQEIRLLERGDVLIDHHTGLAWQKKLIGKDGQLTDNASEIWVGRWLHSAARVQRFNALYNQCTNTQMINEERIQTLIVKHDRNGCLEVAGPLRIILLKDDNMDAANIWAGGRAYIGVEFIARSKPELVAKPIETFTDPS